MSWRRAGGRKELQTNGVATDVVDAPTFLLGSYGCRLWGIWGPRRIRRGTRTRRSRDVFCNGGDAIPDPATSSGAVDCIRNVVISGQFLGCIGPFFLLLFGDVSRWGRCCVKAATAGSDN